MKNTLLFLSATALLIFFNHANAQHNSLMNCDNPKSQAAASQELQKLIDEDQSDRKDHLEWNKWSKEKLRAMAKRDLARIKKVTELSKNGCLKSPRDYLKAALIYQHGDTPDNYYQAYLWSKKALELGEENARSMMAVTIDRYLKSSGKKQLFGTQYSSSENGCFCLDLVEKSFPDSLRKKYIGKSLIDRTDRDFAIFNQDRKCPNVECSKRLKPTPKGTIPNLW